MHRSRIQGCLGVSPRLCWAPLTCWASEKGTPPRRGGGPWGPGPKARKSALSTEWGPAPAVPRSLLTTREGGREAHRRGLGARPPGVSVDTEPCARRKPKRSRSPGRPMGRIEHGPGEGLGATGERGEGTRVWAQGRPGASPPLEVNPPGAPSMHT